MPTTKLLPGKTYRTPPPTDPDPKSPTFCPFTDGGDDCDGYLFTLLGWVGDLTFWRCGECGKDFARIA